MNLFQNISDFNNVNDYLPILNGCLNVDLMLIFLVYHNIIRSQTLSKWYKKYQLSAVIVDTFILFIVIIFARFFYQYLFDSFNILLFTFVAIIIQLTHDMGFYYLFSIVPQGYNTILDSFKAYAKEHGVYILLGDACLIISSCLLSSYFATMSLNMNIITFIISFYFVPYLINYI
jgi:hypothetical protein